MTDAAGHVRGRARVVRPNRAQLTWDLVDPEAWLPADHVARLVWSFVATLDLAALYDKVEAREGAPGRPPADPAVQLSLWLLATIEGIGSARELDRLSERDTWPTAGCRAVFRSTITVSPTSALPMAMCSTIC